MNERESVVARMIDAFLNGNLAVLLIVICLSAGVVSLLVTPREEEPQIVVPLADVLIRYPGGSPEEVERMVSSRLERLLYQIDGVEYVYSISRPGMAVVTVRFYVGEDRERSLTKLFTKLQQNMDRVTPGIESWIVKPIEIDDVPIVNVAFFSDVYGSHELYRVAEEAVGKLQHIPNSANITIYGGEPRVVQVYLDAERLAAYGLSALEIVGSLRVSNVEAGAGAFAGANRTIVVEAGPFLRDVNEVRNLMVGVYEDRPVYLRDVARVEDGPAEVQAYSRFGFGPAADRTAASGGEIGHARRFDPETFRAETFPCVTVAVAKKKGSNAVWVADRVKEMLEELRGTVIPDEVRYRITRDYGETANDKVNNLVQSLGLAILGVIGLIAFTMSWREGLIIAIAVPITYSITLLCNYLFGYTINRVTLFALILALGLLVDDPIVGVDNISRHLALRREPHLKAVSSAMKEVIGPIIMTTLAIIASFLPMFFITGMMGPYMRPMALNVPLAVTMSTVVALAITPWVASKLLKSSTARSEQEPADVTSTRLYRFYNAAVRPLLKQRRRGALVLLVVAVLFGLSCLLALTGRVPLKMLPFDNKNEFQVLVDMPETATLEQTDAVTRELERLMWTVPEVTDFTTTVGIASPMDFNGMVRHYYLRQGPNVADLRVNLLHRSKREADSHAIVLRLRDSVAEIGRRTGANLKLIEVPPGPPVLSTLVAEVRGQPYHRYEELIAAARVVRARMEQEEGVVDVDDSVEADAPKLFFRVDREKAGLSGVSVQDIVQTLGIALEGSMAGVVHTPTEQNELPIVLRLPRAQRSDAARLAKMPVKGRRGNNVQLGELGDFEETAQGKSVLHKNQERVVYVTAEMAGRGPAYAVLALQDYFDGHPLPPGIEIDWRGEGEWKITLDVFRDLGIAFSVALLAIYVLLVYESGSYLLPVIIMLSIPLTMIGIMPGFWVLNLIMDRPVGGYDTPIFFTATAMIGMIALGGIVIRNSILLIDFVKSNVAKGRDLSDAIVEAGATRFRPIFLTTCTTMLGAWPITLDPIFSGLAWALIFGLLMSAAFTLLVVPIVYYLAYRGKEETLLEQGTVSGIGET